jgi:hypothetical protein
VITTRLKRYKKAIEIKPDTRRCTTACERLQRDPEVDEARAASAKAMESAARIR